ncbi:MAG: hypothetical protein K0U86_10325 [Planctomycetes bacterium]|nr:hypothetical protein [Planctomycetota bacterium]MCH9725286.1 hypothetical protein [Planctomycetota bacterium]MCH9779494.1 hypothetical protein [Planctomycetota bacterium]MCH9792631.1 hypothetical protein [Planctomycetota bacterium]
MQALNVLFLIVLFTITFAVIAAIVMSVLYLFGVRRKSRWIFASFVLYCSFVGVDFYLNTRPAVVFERWLGFAPPAHVQDLKSSLWILGDSGRVSLSCTTTEETFDRIIKRGMERMPDVGRSQHYHRRFSEHFGTESEDVYFNASTGRLRYSWAGTD